MLLEDDKNTISNMNKAIKLIILLLMTTAATSAQKLSRELQQSLSKMEMAAYAISSLYVDSVNNDKLAEYAIRGILNDQCTPRCWECQKRSSLSNL